jgi:amino acid permease
VIEPASDIYSGSNPSSFFTILLAFNLQIYSIDLKNELENPTIKRLTMVNRISNLIVLVVNLVISLVSYFALGKKELKDILYKYALSKAKKAW